jgi:hypothetical protein
MTHQNRHEFPPFRPAPGALAFPCLWHRRGNLYAIRGRPTPARTARSIWQLVPSRRVETGLPLSDFGATPKVRQTARSFRTRYEVRLRRARFASSPGWPPAGRPDPPQSRGLSTPHRRSSTKLGQLQLRHDRSRPTHWLQHARLERQGGGAPRRPEPLRTRGAALKTAPIASPGKATPCLGIGKC